MNYKSSILLIFDKYNKQQDYKYIAQEIGTNNYVVGYIVVESPWCSSNDLKKYWIYFNKYGSGGICGGDIDLGLNRIQVKPETISKFTQIEEIKYRLNQGFSVHLSKHSDDWINGEYFITIESEKDIPYKLYKK